MNTERWQQIKAVFEAVLEQPPSKRAAVLDEACGADTDLRAEVESLLNLDEDNTQFLESPAVGTDVLRPVETASDPWIGTMIGPSG